MHSGSSQPGKGGLSNDIYPQEVRSIAASIFLSKAEMQFSISALIRK